MHPKPSNPTHPSPSRRSESALLGLLAAALACAAEPIGWPPASYNPVPLPDDLLVPMPCNGAMAFRVIAVGPEPRELPEGTDFSTLTSPLPVGPGGQGAYLLGKFELTRLQAAALRAYAHHRDCPEPLDPEQVGQDQAQRRAAADQRRPEARIAWVETRGLADDYAAWLRLHADAYRDCRGLGAGPCVPRLGGEAAVVRLPIEPEWEYAARGGQAVGPDTFRYPLPPLEEDFRRYAWTAANADGDPWPIGSRLAGPLGLHDMFGNVSEIQHGTEPSKRGEVFIARGGGYQSQPDQADSRYRDRFRVHDEQGRGRLSETGLRLLIGAPLSAPTAACDEPPLAPDEPPEAALPLWRTSWLVLLLTAVLVAQGLGLLWLRRWPAPAAGTTAPAALPSSPRARERALGLSPAQRGQIAVQLFALGYVVVGTDRRPRRRFSAAQRKAIGAFEQDLGLPPTGYLSEPVLAELAERSAVLSSAGRPDE